MGKVVKWLGIGLGMLASLAAAVVLAHLVSPWPGVMVIRAIFARGAADASATMAAFAPAGIEAEHGSAGDPAWPGAVFDIYRAAASHAERRPVIFWIHGGAFVSGSPADVSGYAKILAAEGYTVVTPAYTLAPTAKFPQPVAEVSATIRHVLSNPDRYGADPSRVVLAGDSAGAQLAAQIAAVATAPSAAEKLGVSAALDPGQLRGAILFCGPYDLSLMHGKGVGGLFLGTVARAYAGTRDWANDPGFARFSVTSDVTSAFPPTFISAGNADPLLRHSVALAEILKSKGVPVETLFFPEDRTPALAHEYQFNLDTPAAQDALGQAIAFLARVTAG